MLFYSPKFILPKRYNNTCSQVDVLPSIAGLAKASYRNTTFGRNLFDSASKKENVAFIYDDALHTIGIINDQYYYLRNLNSNNEEFLSMLTDAAVPKNNITDSIKNHLQKLTLAYYETAKYMLLNNKKK
ncbi:MAG: hypothetical protein IPP48_02295 [Chitinophagaceae bacterium]|nr:hypothetical protein [Chitinophagaceae bacterium]